MLKIITWRTIELITFAIGAFMFVASSVSGGNSNAGLAGVGAFLIVLGLLLKDWRNNSLIDSNDRSKNLIFGFIIIIVFTLWSLNHRNINSIEDDIYYMKNDIESMKSNINDLEYDSHSH